ncbi:hypothetical protein PoB_007207900 [Plakobranchus ocellatus]|uniref:Uncharacterized protein n=1 Tax=Plakobranchus ocellatus TaxID=259542 RepID=A0AAV4DN19_9GAST|nr:hypothetical protein PoB_007207900 [Plakobranchus ocellatus]
MLYAKKRSRPYFIWLPLHSSPVSRLTFLPSTQIHSYHSLKLLSLPFFASALIYNLISGAISLLNSSMSINFVGGGIIRTMTSDLAQADVAPGVRV